MGPARHRCPFHRFNPLRTQKRATRSTLCGSRRAEPWPCGCSHAEVRTEPARLIARISFFRSKDTNGESPQALGHPAFLWTPYANVFTFSFPSCLFCDSVILLRSNCDCHFAVLLSSDKMEALEESVTTTARAF